MLRTDGVGPSPGPRRGRRRPDPGGHGLEDAEARLDLLRRLPWLASCPADGAIERAGLYPIAKRLLDLSLVLLATPVVGAAIAACAVALKIESLCDPVLFVQIRTGRQGRRFRMFKFRTMVRNAESLQQELRDRNELLWPDFKIEDDPRITRVGRFLRRWSLDELPQIFNVVLGDMSLVGPRPTSFGPETYEEWQKQRLVAVPGLTGLWQIVGRGSMEFDERVRLDLAYIERQCLGLDLRILARTVRTVLIGDGSH